VPWVKTELGTRDARPSFVDGKTMRLGPTVAVSQDLPVGRVLGGQDSRLLMLALRLEQPSLETELGCSDRPSS
jgi:hypothetical protein